MCFKTQNKKVHTACSLIIHTIPNTIWNSHTNSSVRKVWEPAILTLMFSLFRAPVLKPPRQPGLSANSADGVFVPVGCGKLSEWELRYSMVQKDCLAIWWAVDGPRNDLLECPFTLCSDHFNTWELPTARLHGGIWFYRSSSSLWSTGQEHRWLWLTERGEVGKWFREQHLTMLRSINQSSIPCMQFLLELCRSFVKAAATLSDPEKEMK